MHCHQDAYKYSNFPWTINTWNFLPLPLVSAPSIDYFKNGLHKEFFNGNMYVIPPRGHYDWPMLDSASYVAVVSQVYKVRHPSLHIGMLHDFTIQVLQTFYRLCVILEY